ncbi:MAG: sugar ABC transporter ATP-binding protein [Thermomicrobiales bacterium]
MSDEEASPRRGGPGQTPLLRMSGISKTFPGVKALDEVSVTVFPGECLALLGENGAGKSTLMKVLSGVYQPDGGEIAFDGDVVTLSSPRQAQALGISIIYQEFNLMPNLTVAENVFIGREPNSGGFVNRHKMEADTRVLLQRLGVALDPRATVRDLSVAEQQMVEIAKALSTNARLVIMDEPTSALTDREVDSLLAIVNNLKAQGLGVIFITHRLDELAPIGDWVTVLRDGRNAGEMPMAEATPDAIVRMMVGRHIADLYEKIGHSYDPNAAPVLEVRGLSRTGSAQDATQIVLHDVNFGVRAGEIVGLAGLVGSGRTEVARAIFGADRFDAGQVLLNGQPVTITTPRDAIRHGIGLVPEDRKQQGLVLSLAVRENIALPSLDKMVKFGFVQSGEEQKLGRRFVDALRIRTPSLEQQVINLSGGNQQKVVIAKWLALQPQVLILDEPTRGIDVGAKAEVHSLIAELARQGVAVLMISSELPEILGMSDRVLVMHEGHIVADVPREDATEETIMRYATGVDRARLPQVA